MAAALNVAKYIIKSLPTDNLKLQKLLYYSQAVYLVLNDKRPLFPEDIEAWDYGPVVPPVYREYKKYGLEPIPLNDNAVPLSLDEIRSVDLVLAGFGAMTGPELIKQTHYEAPWRNAYSPGRPSRKISLDALYSYFKENLDFDGDEIQRAG
jgi:uncharacterized phage-associated protein